ncbi:HYR domain-containing protein [Lysobacter niastensis]|uniref:HYR domain-containing protein n=1 Tax=Lysobacter niastensis TaxID=380629 RepID=A0ABS0BAT9_9GAMM|nr:HYR domain-containing protein [Lysobacter niastensis]MBF6025937.1 HYR domain-containing protein [Lysobacter niastensis]
MKAPSAHGGRRGLAVFVFLAAGAFATPALAANDCKNPSVKIQGSQVYDGFPDSIETSPGNFRRNTITLNNSPSSKPEPGPNAIYTWSQGTGQTAGSFNTTSGPSTTFTVPDVGTAGETITVTMRVQSTEPGCVGTFTDTVTLNVVDRNNVIVNNPPVAAASASPAVADEGVTVTLSSAGSNDPEGKPLSYTWSQQSGAAVVLSDIHTPSATFQAPNTAYPNGATLVFRLTVNDGVYTDIEDVTVNISWVNDPPVTALTCPSAVNERQPIALNGSASRDGDNGIASYAWSGGWPQLNLSGFATNSISVPARTLGYQDAGFYTFRLTTTDAMGAFTFAECAVQIRDVTAPVFTLPADIVQEASSAAGNVVLYTASAFDAVDGSLPAPNFSCAPASASTFAVKTTPVTCSASDSAGNSAQGAFNVTIQDTTAPVLNVPLAFGVEATGPDGAIVEYFATSTDIVDGVRDATCAPASGTQFVLGDTTVTCAATDDHGNAAASKSFIVTVHDTTAPAIDAHEDITGIEATGPTGAVVTFDNPATHDIVDGDGIANCLPQSGSTFPVGTSIVHCRASDAAGNRSTSQFSVTVVDSTPPVIAPHDDVIAEATSAAGADVTYTPPGTIDLVSGAGTAVCLPASGSLFELGSTEITCNASDTAGNAAEPTYFNVIVRDSTPPVIDQPDDVGPLEATSAAGAQAFYTSPQTHDAVDGTGTASCSPVSGTVFALGQTEVTCSAHDAAGNVATPKSFFVNVHDTTPPVIDPHADIPGVEATGPAGAVVTFDGPATHDIVDGDGVSTCAPASGSVFAIGATNVSCAASDAAGNAGKPSGFVVTVVDTTAPAVTAPPGQVVEATGPLTEVDIGQATATDAVGVVSLTHDAPSAFALGATTVIWTARDAAGNTGTATQTVTVRDTTAPAISVPEAIVREATSPDGATVTFVASAHDLVYGNVAVSCAPASGSTFALGTTTVACSSTDGSGNTGSASFTVTVQDTTRPVISYLGPVNVTAGSNATAVVNYPQPTASDIVDVTVPVICGPESGSTFSIGTTQVRCSATDKAGNKAEGSFPVTVSFAWNGFFRPVDMAPTLNSSKAGSAIPLKFSLGSYQGMSIMAAGYPKSAPMGCSSNEDPLLETVTAGQSSLQYDASANQYVYVWKSEKSWAGTCRQIQVKLIDGSVHTANFSFK